MQISTAVQAKENNWLTILVTGAGIIVGIVLVGIVFARMGLLNGLRGGGATAVSPTALAITTENMQFGQETLRVKADQSISFLLENKDFYGHSFDIDELGWHVQMPANDQIDVEFTAVPPGTYTIYCAVPGHREAGMVATLIIEQ